MILTCRSGDYAHLEGFRLLELSPLTPHQVEEVAARWLDDSTDFFDQLKENPARDLVDRPLFLAQLLVVYKNGGERVPSQPSALYRQITRLLLQDWDEQRKVTRRSSYAHFHVEEKLEFLSALAFELTVEYKTTRFTASTLEGIYRKLAKRFELPEGEANRVAREIESHTGLVVESGGEYEFSHLSLQEYLCGYHIVRMPFTGRIVLYFNAYPAPLAVASALSADPTRWVASLVLNDAILSSPTSGRSSVGSFVARLGQERPRFMVDRPLGFALVKLMIGFPYRDATPFRALSRNKEVAASVAMALEDYSVREASLDEVQLNYEGAVRAGQLYAPPRAGRVKKEVYEVMTRGEERNAGSGAQTSL